MWARDGKKEGGEETVQIQGLAMERTDEGAVSEKGIPGRGGMFSCVFSDAMERGRQGHTRISGIHAWISGTLSGSLLETTLFPGDIWQSLKTFKQGEGLPLASTGQRINILRAQDSSSQPSPKGQ